MLQQLFIAAGGSAIAGAVVPPKPQADIAAGLELLQAIRPGDTDPELTTLMDQAARGNVGLPEVTKFITKRISQAKSAPDNDCGVEEVVVCCPHCDRIAIVRPK